MQEVANYKYKIKKFRIERGLTPKELAKKCKLSPGYINQLENEDYIKNPTVDTLSKIASVLGINIDCLLMDDLNVYKGHSISQGFEYIMLNEYYSLTNKQKQYILNMLNNLVVLKDTKFAAKQPELPATKDIYMEQINTILQDFSTENKRRVLKLIRTVQEIKES